MGQCVKLKFGRKQLKLSQKAFAEKVGLSLNTIHKLETDETAWLTALPSTIDAIYGALEGVNYWVKDNKPTQELTLDEPVIDELDYTVVEPEPKPVIEEVKANDGLHKRHSKTLILIDFAVEGLKEAETNEDFMANIKLLKRILKDY